MAPTRHQLAQRPAGPTGRRVALVATAVALAAGLVRLGHTCRSTAAERVPGPG